MTTPSDPYPYPDRPIPTRPGSPRPRRLAAFAALVALMFATLPAMASPVSAFTDDDGSVHERDIETLAATRITVGCGPALFCPGDNVTRAQMASFLRRALGNVPDTTRDYFRDDEASVHESDINAMAVLGVVFGCTGAEYCPDSPLTRAEMAAFMYNTDLLPTVVSNPPRFEDVPRGHDFYQEVESIAHAGVTFGCSPTLYCPTNPVTREQMASFLVRLFDL